jgi:hypothetical protein
MSTKDSPDATDPIRAALARANNWYSTAAGLVDLGQRARSYWRARRNFTVTVDGSDSSYQDIHDWLLANVPTEQQRALAVHSGRYDEDDFESPVPIVAGSGSVRKAPALRVTYESSAEQRIQVDGRQVWVSVEKGPEGARGGKEPDRILFRCTSKVAQQAVIDHLQHILANHKVTQRQPQLRMMTTWGSWQTRHDVPPRPLGSVVLRAGQIESLIADLGGFLDQEDEYVRRAIPWHRGYLLQGPPGTGKTSVAKALAHHFGLDLYYAPLGDVSKDTNLLSLIGEVRPRSVLLLEDIDIFHAATSREAKTDQVTLSGLLNTLDGVATPHGLITILTSNEPKVLDQALVRPGRVDRTEEIDYLTTEQARRLFAYFYGHAPRRDWTVDGQTPAAELTELFKRHMDDPAAAEDFLEFESVNA